MSNYWRYRCLRCGTEPEDCSLNHGQDVLLRAARHCWPLIKPVYVEQLKGDDVWPWQVDVEITLGYQNGSPWEFLLEHEAHGIEVVDEYGREGVVAIEPKPDEGEKTCPDST